MNIYSNRLSFNIAEIYGIDGANNHTQAQLQAEYDGLVFAQSIRGVGCPPMLLASLTHLQVEAAKFLVANDFKPIGTVKINPNSGNKITNYLKISKEPRPSMNVEEMYQFWIDATAYRDTRSKPYLNGSAISCSTQLLINPDLITSDELFVESVVKKWRPQCAIVLTALPNSKMRSAAILMANGFFKVAEASGYYKDTESFTLYMRYVNREDRKTHNCQTTYDTDGRTE